MKGKERILMTEWPEMLNFVFEKSEFLSQNSYNFTSKILVS